MSASPGREDPLFKIAARAWAFPEEHEQEPHELTLTECFTGCQDTDLNVLQISDSFDSRYNSVIGVTFNISHLIIEAHSSQVTCPRSQEGNCLGT